jgi:Na+/H+-dicarboxylate symporter
MSDGPKLAEVLDGVDENKRETLTRLITGTSFVVPIVASFAMDGLTIGRAAAAAPNGSGPA